MTEKTDLTKRQRQILEYIKEYIQEKGYSPSVRDISAHFSLASPAGVHKHVNNLKKKGVIDFEKSISRSIRVTGEPRSRKTALLDAPMIELPLKGKVAAGAPIQYILDNETVIVPEAMVKKPDKTYVLQVKGDSMIEDCVCDGDYIAVEHREYADNGQMVIAMINHEEATLKKYYKEKDQIRLQPSNSSMDPIFVKPEDLSIQGLVVGVMRFYP